MAQNETFPIIFESETEKLIEEQTNAKIIADKMKETAQKLIGELRDKGIYPQYYYNKENVVDSRMVIVMKPNADDPSHFMCNLELSTKRYALDIWTNEQGEIRSMSGKHFDDKGLTFIKGAELMDSKLPNSLKTVAAYVQENSISKEEKSHVIKGEYSLRSFQFLANKYFGEYGDKVFDKDGKQVQAEYATYNKDEYGNERVTLASHDNVAVEIGRTRGELYVKAVEFGEGNTPTSTAIEKSEDVGKYISNENILKMVGKFYDETGIDEKDVDRAIISNSTRIKMKSAPNASYIKEASQKVKLATELALEDAPMTQSYSPIAARMITDKAKVFVEQDTRLNEESGERELMFKKDGSPKMRISVSLSHGNDNLTLYASPNVSNGVRFTDMVGYKTVDGEDGNEKRIRINKDEIANSELGDEMKAIAAAIYEKGVIREYTPISRDSNAKRFADPMELTPLERFSYEANIYFNEHTEKVTPATPAATPSGMVNNVYAKYINNDFGEKVELHSHKNNVMVELGETKEGKPFVRAVDFDNRTEGGAPTAQFLNNAARINEVIKDPEMRHIATTYLNGDLEKSKENKPKSKEQVER